MKYPDYEFYRMVFHGSEKEDIIMPFIRAAGDILRGYVMKDGLSEREESELFGAVCAQAEFMADNEGVSSVKLGDFSAVYAEVSAVCPRALAILEGAGLFFRGGVMLGG